MSYETSIQGVVVSTTNYVPGYRVKQHLGVAYGVTVRSRGMGGDCMANCESTCGGEVTAYTEMVIESRNQAVQRLIADAQRLGGNAVLSVRFDSDEIGQGGNTATIAYGTAVFIIPE